MKVYFRFFILVGFFAYSVVCFSQNNGKSENIRELAGSDYDDSLKIQSLLKIARTTDGKPVDGLMAAREALALAEENDFLMQSAVAYQELALIYRKLGNYSKAIENSFSALKIFDKLKLSENLAAMQLQIGSHYVNDDNFERGIFYISQAMESFRERKDTFNIAITLVNLGETFRLKGELDKATACFKECLDLNKSLKNEQIEGYAIGNLGMVYVEQDNFQDAIEALNASIKILNEMDDVYSVSVYQCELANVYIRLGNKEKGGQLLKSSLKMAQNQELKEQIRDISKDLADYYEQQKQYDRALYYQKQYAIYHDSLVNIDNVRRIEQVESGYWLDLKEADIRFLEQANRTQRNVVILLSGSALILLTMLFFLYRLQLSRKRAYQKVSEQKAIIEKREQEKALLLKELNHRVKNNLQMVSSMFSLQAGQLRGSPAVDALTAARRRIDALMLIHQKLYRENVDTHILLSDYIKELIDSLVYSFDKQVKIQFDLTPVSLQIDSAIPLGIVINELITNSLKYAPEGEEATLTVSVKQQEQTISVIIADNGPGLPQDLDIQKASSLGLKLVFSLIKQLHGGITQVNDNGCRWEIVLNTGKV